MPTIEHIALWARDIDRCCGFYAQYFGAAVGRLYENPAKRFRSRFLSFDSGSRVEVMQTTLFEPERSAPGAQRMGWTHMAVAVGSVAGVDSLTQQLKDDGFDIVDGPRRTGDGYYQSVVIDPEGNRVEITV